MTSSCFCRTRVLSLGLALALSSGALGGGDPCAGDCQTIVEGGVVSVTWAIEGSPYCVETSILVGDLTIEPGVCVRVAEGAFIDVLAPLVASGTEDNPITFTADGTSWNGIRFADSPDGSLLEWCHIEQSVNRGLRITNSRPEIRDCTITDCTSVGDGGGVMIVNNTCAPVRFEGCTISGNTANPNRASGEYRGGGVYSVGPAEFIDCVIEGNRARSFCGANGCGTTARGGGVFASNGIRLERCMIVSNVSDGRADTPTRPSQHASRSYGGGVYLTGANNVIIASLISENTAAASSNDGGFGTATATARGGGIYSANGPHRLDNVILACNSLSTSAQSTSRSGSGVYQTNGTSEYGNCTIARNTGAHGVAIAGGSCGIRNSIIYNNNADGAQISGSPNIRYSNVQGTYPGEGNITLNPGFSGLDCSVSDLVIASFSPCVDAGDPDSAYDDSVECASPPYEDARNDMGAHGGPSACAWLFSDPVCVADINGDGELTSDDFFAFFECFFAADLCADVNEACEVNSDDFFDFLALLKAGCD